MTDATALLEPAVSARGVRRSFGDVQAVRGIDLDVKDASVFDDVIVGTIEANWCINYRGKPIQDCVLLTDVWVCDDGEWRVVRRHSSPLPDAECTTGAGKR